MQFFQRKPLLSSNKGSSLIEVLVSLLLMALGVLAFIELQITSVHNTESSFSRNQAMIIAMDLVERIRINKRAWSRYSTMGVLVSSANSAPNVGAYQCSSSQCTPEQLAVADRSEITQFLSQQLENSTALIKPNCRVGSQLACAVVAWNGFDATGCMPLMTTLNANFDIATCVVLEFWPPEYSGVTP